MTEEQAVKRCNELIKESHSCWIGIANQEAIKSVLFMLKKKDKIIDLMAEIINNYDIDEDVCKQMGQKANCNEFEDTKKCKECIKQYFENKAKEIK